MAKTQRAPAAPYSARAGQHPHSIVIERQEGESAEAWEAMIRDLEAAAVNVVIRLDDNSIGLRRRMARASA